MTPQAKVNCPLARVREALKWERHELAALAGVPYNLLANAELGYFKKIPNAILDTIEPYLMGIGTTSERLQEEFGAWRAGLGEEVRVRTAKQLKERACA